MMRFNHSLKILWVAWIAMSAAFDCRAQSEYVLRCNEALNRCIIKDGFSAPVASRIYAYCNISMYEALCGFNRDCKSFGGRLSVLRKFQLPGLTNTDARLVAVGAFCYTAKHLVFSDRYINEYLQTEAGKVADSGKLRSNSLAYARQISDSIWAWAAKDGYPETRSMPRYEMRGADSCWQPTLPMFSYASEPYWGKIRSFTLDSASQFRPDAPLSFDTGSLSLFYKQAQELQAKSNTLTEEEKNTADFWNDNPMITDFQGHFSKVTKGITPGGHWIHIAAQTAVGNKLEPAKASYITALVAIAVADGFISCWEAKYHYETIRPVTYVRQYINKEWEPYIETPPFPEYPSGHSVISAAASYLLTRFFGDNFAFSDSNEIAPRSFSSFYEASYQAGMSRYYGGIHFMPAINNGRSEGMKIGEWVWKESGTDDNFISAEKPESPSRY